jgi:hypothetical protein
VFLFLPKHTVETLLIDDPGVSLVLTLILFFFLTLAVNFIVSIRMTTSYALEHPYQALSPGCACREGPVEFISNRPYVARFKSDDFARLFAATNGLTIATEEWPDRIAATMFGDGRVIYSGAFAAIMFTLLATISAGLLVAGLFGG